MHSPSSFANASFYGPCLSDRTTTGHIICFRHNPVLRLRRECFKHYPIDKSHHQFPWIVLACVPVQVRFHETLINVDRRSRKGRAEMTVFG
jgi:hypothetical protein